MAGLRYAALSRFLIVGSSAASSISRSGMTLFERLLRSLYATGK